MTATQACTAKCSFEFIVSNVDKLKGTFCTPPFATSTDHFWQVKFDPNPKDIQNHCSVFLCAIPNSEEELSNTLWARRHKVNVMMWMKDAAGSNNSSHIVNPVELKMGNYSKEKQVWGFPRFCRKAVLTKNVIIGISLSEAKLDTDRTTTPLSRNGMPTNLLEAWLGELNNSDISDIQFLVQGKHIYARSFILKKRSEYFNKLLKEEDFAYGMRIVRKQPGRRNTQANREADIDSLASLESIGLYTYIIEVPDFKPETFLEMLRYLYTNTVIFDDDENSGTTIIDMLKIADKYYLDDLRQVIISELSKRVKKAGAAETLGEIVWKVPGFKQDMIDLVLKAFPESKAIQVLQQVSKTVTRKKQQHALQTIGKKSYKKYVEYCRMQMIEADDPSMVKVWAEKTVDAQVIYSLIDHNDEWWAKVAGLTIQEAQPIVDDFNKEKSKKGTEKKTPKSRREEPIREGVEWSSGSSGPSRQRRDVYDAPLDVSYERSAAKPSSRSASRDRTRSDSRATSRSSTSRRLSQDGISLSSLPGSSSRSYQSRHTSRDRMSSSTCPRSPSPQQRAQDRMSTYARSPSPYKKDRGSPVNYGRPLSPYTEERDSYYGYSRSHTSYAKEHVPPVSYGRSPSRSSDRDIAYEQEGGRASVVQSSNSRSVKNEASYRDSRSLDQSYHYRFERYSNASSYHPDKHSTK